MTRRSGAPSILLAIICLLMASGAARPEVRPGAQATTPVDKVGQALAAMDKAQALSEISQTLKAASLTEQELTQLADKIQKGPLLQKLEGLKDKALAASTLAKATNGPNAAQLLQQKRLALRQARAERIAQSNTAVMKLKLVRSAAAAATVPPPPPQRISVSGMAALMSSGRTTSSGRITDVGRIVVGEEITVRGTGFGNTEGRVAIIIRRDLYYCTVTTWTSTRIVCTVPDDLESAVRDALDGVRALLWVKLSGGETGPTLDTRVLPNPETYTPTIDSITPTEISPGQSFIIRGRNLVKYRFDRARVRLLFGSEVSVQATIEDPQHEFIQAKIPDDYGGMQRTVCRLEVSNDLGFSAEQTVTFTPAEEILDIRTPGTLLAACQPPFPGFLCLIGDTSRATVHDIVLKNSWVVEDCVLDIDAHGVNAGAHYIEEPARGATLARAVVEAWADAYSRVTVTETLFIKGPRGVAYR
jgi:hypothetical protein